MVDCLWLKNLVREKCELESTEKKIAVCLSYAFDVVLIKNAVLLNHIYIFKILCSKIGSILAESLILTKWKVSFLLYWNLMSLYRRVYLLRWEIHKYLGKYLKIQDNVYFPFTALSMWSYCVNIALFFIILYQFLAGAFSSSNVRSS